MRYLKREKFDWKSAIHKIPFGRNFIQKIRSHFIRQALTDSTLGEITLGESIFLGELVRCIENSGPIIEIGTLFGKSSIVITLNKRCKNRLLTIDNYSWNPLGLTSDIHFQVTQHILSDATKRFNVKILNIDKKDYYLNYSGEAPSLVFMDAVHTYEETKKDILWAKQIKASVICGHDYNEEKHPEVVKAVNEFGGPKKLVESLWVL